MIGVLVVVIVVLVLLVASFWFAPKRVERELESERERARYWQTLHGNLDRCASEDGAAAAKRLRSEQSARERSDEKNASLSSELAELRMYANGLESTIEDLKRKAAPAVKKNLPQKINGRKVKRA